MMAVVLTTYSIFEIVDWNSFYDDNTIINLFSSFGIALFLLLASTIISDKKQWSKKFFWITKLIGTLIIAISLFVLSHYDIEDNYRVVINIAATIGISFFISLVIPFLKKEEDHDFWYFYQRIFTRFALTIIFSSIIYGGLAAAYAIIDGLFSFNISSDTYAITAAIIYCLAAAPWSFLAIIPRDYAAHKGEEDYPVLFKFLGKYILLVLLGLYFIIIYVYGAKILITSTWPEGVVAYMIMGISVLGTLTLIILYPLTKEGGSKFMRNLPFFYHIFLLPLLLLYFSGIGMRISDYGLTLNRYFLLVFGVWQTVVSLYFIFSKRDIRFTFISLACFITFAFFSPWNAFKVCSRSQMNRLTEIFENNDILNNGKIDNELHWVQNNDSTDYQLSNNDNKNARILSSEDQEDIESIVEYMCEYHNIDPLIDIFTGDIPLTDSHWNNRRKILGAIGINYQMSNGSAQSYTISTFDYTFDQTAIISVTNYDYILLVNYIYDKSSPYSFKGEDLNLDVKLKNSGIQLIFANDSTNLDLASVIEWAKDQEGFEAYEPLQFDANSSGVVTGVSKDYEISFSPRHIAWQYNTSTKQFSANSVEGHLFLKKR